MGASSHFNRDAFINAVQSQFPEIAAIWQSIDDGSLHLEVAAFRRCVETAMDEGRLWDVERYCRFIADFYTNADEALNNAIGASFVENFSLGEFAEQRRKAVHERIPKSLRDEIYAINNRWR